MIEIKIATTDKEIKEIVRLRYEVYVEEMGVYTNLANHAERVLTDERDSTDRLIYATEDGVLIGAGSVSMGSDFPISEELRTAYDFPRFEKNVSEKGMGAITRLVVKPSHRGSSVPFKLMVAFFEEFEKNGADLIFCTCQPHLLNMYNRLGLRSYDIDVQNDPEFGIMIPLVFVMGDKAHLQTVRSPLRSMVCEERHNRNTVAKLVATLGTPKVYEANNHHTVKECATLTKTSLKQEVIFNGLNEEEIREVIGTGHIIDCKAGDRITRKGQENHTIFVTLKGCLEIKNENDGTAQVNAGEVFGELPFLPNNGRNENAYSGPGGVRILGLNKRHFQKIIAQSGKIATTLLHNLGVSDPLLFAQIA